MGQMDRWLVAMVGGALFLVVAGFVLLVAVQARTPETLPEDTPAGVVQRYLQALSEGRYDDADKYLTQSVLDRRKDLEKNGQVRPPVPPGAHDRPSTRIVLQSVEARRETVWVTVAISSFTAPSPTRAQEYTNTMTFGLRQEQGAWKITSPEYPYYLPF